MKNLTKKSLKQWFGSLISQAREAKQWAMDSEDSNVFSEKDKQAIRQIKELIENMTE